MVDSGVSSYRYNNPHIPFFVEGSECRAVESNTPIPNEIFHEWYSFIFFTVRTGGMKAMLFN